MVLEWKLFLKKEFKNAISKYNNSSVPGSDKILWKILKQIINFNNCLVSIINITNACINLGYLPLHFKSSTSIIIPKPNKSSYDSPKLFHPIILLNIFSKLIEKVIRERTQFHTITNNFIYPYQFSRLKQHSTSDASMFLVVRRECGQTLARVRVSWT